jgi:hypothetical protein
VTSPAVAATAIASTQRVILVISATALKATEAILIFLTVVDVEVLQTLLVYTCMFQSLTELLISEIVLLPLL